ncbi:hypothetical protein RHSIM_Rhsim11G0161900 [Rhododendron simsii]|uniref:Uncharacterized protein n=1 Tax=Rhododendron simsii TaxID=118357 RepID=A0A834L8I4_RHOSS|nr:hypothetical protein RHSIM_Rhsim11G0161900 [Rhododendron simsii]
MHPSKAAKNLSSLLRSAIKTTASKPDDASLKQFVGSLDTFSSSSPTTSTAHKRSTKSHSKASVSNAFSDLAIKSFKIYAPLYPGNTSLPSLILLPKAKMGQLHVFFFPLMAHGHMIPTLDIAKLFAARGVKSTIITTPMNVHFFQKSVERTNQMGFEMGILTLEFPAAAVGLPEGCESADQLTSDDMFPKFIKAVTMLQYPLERILDEVRPDYLVADIIFPWATEVAAKFNIPRLVFHGTSFFALCASENMRLYKPQGEVSSDDEPFLVPDLPHQIKLTKMQLSEDERDGSESDFMKLRIKAKESELSSYGVIANSFYELETEYADYYRNVLKRRAWHIGPVSLCNREVEDKAHRVSHKHIVYVFLQGVLLIDFPGSAYL